MGLDMTEPMQLWKIQAAFKTAAEAKEKTAATHLVLYTPQSSGYGGQVVFGSEQLTTITSPDPLPSPNDA